MKKRFSPRLVAGIVLAVALCIGAVIYTGVTGSPTGARLTLGDLLTPLQQKMTVLSSVVGMRADAVTEYEALLQENDSLRLKIAELEQQVRDQEADAAENVSLRELVGIAQRNREFQYDIAEVISRNPGDWNSVISIDKGRGSGIEVGDLAVTADGVLGAVSAVGEGFSEITTLLDPELHIGALIARNHLTAVAEGDYSLLGDNKLRLSYLDRTADLLIGDTVETSGRGGVYPKGVQIGTVESILTEDDGMSNYAIIRPFVNVDEVNTVYIIKDFTITE